VKIRSITVPLSLALFAVAALWESIKLPFGVISTPGPGFFPTLLASLLLIAAIAVCLERAGDTDERPATELTTKKNLLTIILLAGFATLLEFLGYLITTILFVLLLLWAVERRSVWFGFLVAVSAAVISYVVFKWLLGAPLPEGILAI
jgi:putative tricarboxylic transport membrane protein